MSLPILEDDKPRAHIMEEMETEEINTDELQEPMQNLIEAFRSGRSQDAIDLFIKLIKKVKK